MKVFVDANIFLDIFDLSRVNNGYSTKAYEYLIQTSTIYTSCDLITTVYYINSKNDKYQAVLNIQALTKTLKIIDFSNKEVLECCELMLNNSNFIDLEDTIQYILAKKEKCDLILSNDINFKSVDIDVITSEQYCLKYSID